MRAISGQWFEPVGLNSRRPRKVQVPVWLSSAHFEVRARESIPLLCFARQQIVDRITQLTQLPAAAFDSYKRLVLYSAAGFPA